MRTIATSALPFVLSLLASVTSWSCGGKATEESPASSPSACDWDYEVLDPSNLLDSASLQIAVFDQACPTDQALARGDLTQALVVERVASGQPLPSFCDLPAAAYCMVVVATGECAVVGFGGTPFDLSHHKHVTTVIQPVDSPISQCTAAQQCVNHACVSSEAGAPDGNPDGDVGAPDGTPDGSSGPWTLVGVGQLPLGNDPGGALASLSTVLTPSGFVIAYRDRHASDDGADGVRVFVSDDGAVGTVTRFALTSCSGSADEGGAAAWSDLAGSGFQAMGESACSAGDSPNMHVSLFDAHGATTNSVEYPLPDEVRLAPVHGAAAAPGGPQFLLAAVSVGAGLLYTFDGTAVQTSITSVGNHSSIAEVATSNAVLATLADDLNASGQVIGSVALEGSAVPTNFTLPPSDTGAIVAWDDKAMGIVVQGDQLAWGAANATGTGHWQGNIASGARDSVDVAREQDHVMVGAGKSGEITLWVIDGANSAPHSMPSAQLDLAPLIGFSPLPGYDGRSLSMAAGRGRVLIVWASKGAGKPPGMYAILASPN